MYQSPNLRHDDANVRDAVRFGAGVAAAGIGFLVLAAMWVSTCNGATADTLACGAPQRTLLAIGAPAIMLIGGLLAFVRTYQAWRKGHAWWAWQGAGLLLLAMTVVTLTIAVSPLAGTAVIAG